MAVYPVRLFPDGDGIFCFSSDMLKIWGSIEGYLTVDELLPKMRIPSEKFFSDLLSLVAMGLVRMDTEPFWGLGVSAEAVGGKKTVREKRSGLFRGVVVLDD